MSVDVTLDFEDRASPALRGAASDLYAHTKRLIERGGGIRLDDLPMAKRMAEVMSTSLADIWQLLLKENDMSPQSTRNPYERRGFERMLGATSEERLDQVREARTMTRLTAAETRDHDGLTLGDLDDLVRSKVATARRDGGEAEAETGLERRREAQRISWDEGHAAGELDGLFAYWPDVERQIMERVQVIRDEAVKTLAVPEKKVPKADLRAKLEQIGRECENIAGLFNDVLRPDTWQAARRAGG